MKERQLVGRRYEDFLHHGIEIRLTGEEQVWRMMYAEPRFQSFIDRRKTIRRRSEIPPKGGEHLLNPQCSFVYLVNLLEEIR